MDDANEEQMWHSLEAVLMDDTAFLESYDDFMTHCNDDESTAHEDEQYDHEHDQEACPGCQFDAALEILVNMNDGFEHIATCPDHATCNANQSVGFIKHTEPESLNDLLLLANRCQRAIAALSQIARDAMFVAYELDEEEQ